MNFKKGRGAAGNVREVEPQRQQQMAREAAGRDEAIRARAHQIYLSRLNTGRQGDAVSDWFEAERQLQEESTPQAIEEERHGMSI